MSTDFDRWPGMCRKAAYGPSGFGSAYEPVEHDWRLLSRERMYENEYEPQAGAPGYGNVKIITVGHREVWYCTRCRTVEESEVKT